jgi:hypothetical protein
MEENIKKPSTQTPGAIMVEPEIIMKSITGQTLMKKITMVDMRTTDDMKILTMVHTMITERGIKQDA